MKSNQIKLVLFDLGGVLVELGAEIFPKSWVPENQSFGLKQWFKSEAAINFETGNISTEEFISDLKQTLNITESDKDVLAAFKAWPKGLFPATDKVLNRLKVDYKLAVLSNSNEIHEPVLMDKFGLRSRVDDVFFSHLIGHSKPKKEAFDHVLTVLEYKPGEVMFFDDSAENVYAAQRLGMKAYQVSSPLDVARFI